MTIAKLVQEDNILTTHEDKQEAVWNFYSGLLGTSVSRTATINLGALGCRTHDLSALDIPISEAEVWDTVKALPMDKAPGPDGFTGRFYKVCWETIKLDIMHAVGALHGGDSRKLHLLNSAFMVLIPKKEDATQVRDYRPISLVHSFAKLITKVMANRLAGRLGEIVASNQSAFVKGRSLHDNFALVQQTARLLHCQKRSAVMLKLDISKAFDSVSWAFLLEVLAHRGFGDKWRSLLSNLLSTSSTRILPNGEPGDVIRHQRGLRQGDPLSPMLFIIVMDVLTTMVLKAEALELLQPLASRQHGHRMSVYVDDVALFISPRDQDMSTVKRILDIFGSASGLHTNMAKSSALPIQCPEPVKEQVREAMNCQIATFPCKYLGIPLTLQRLTAADLQPIIDKIADALPAWKASLLGKSGQLILVRAVLTAIPIHVLLAIDVPRWFVKEIDKYRRRFL